MGFLDTDIQVYKIIISSLRFLSLIVSYVQKKVLRGTGFNPKLYKSTLNFITQYRNYGRLSTSHSGRDRIKSEDAEWKLALEWLVG